MMQPLPEARHISQTFQADFDRMLCNTLENHHSSPGFTLLLGNILQYTSLRQPSTFYPPGLVAFLYLVRQKGEGHILDDMGFSGITAAYGEFGAEKFLTYFKLLLENPERSGTHAFDQHRYAIAAKECLELYLCKHHKISKGAAKSACHDKALLRNKPWAWKVRLGTDRRIPKAIRWWKSLNTPNIDQYASFPESSFEYEYSRSLSYQWTLDLLPIFLERSAISLELADVLRTRTFTTMAPAFPRRMRLARQAIATYLLRVESAVGDHE